MSIYQQNVFLESDDEDGEKADKEGEITFNDEREADAWLRANGFK